MSPKQLYIFSFFFLLTTTLTAMVVMADEGQDKINAYRLNVFIKNAAACLNPFLTQVFELRQCVNTLAVSPSFEFSNQDGFTALSANITGQAQAFVKARKPLILQTLNGATLDAKTEKCLVQAVVNYGVPEADVKLLPTALDDCLTEESSLSQQQDKSIQNAFMDNITKTGKQLSQTFKDFYVQYVKVY